MKAIAFTVLALLAVACTNANYENSVSNRPDTEMADTSRVYTISCEMAGEWVNFQTKRHPYNSYGGRSGVWSFKTTEGKSVWATNCSATIEAE
jgi:hypothetical protein